MLGEWIKTDSLPQTISNTVGVTVNNKFYIIGGFEFATEIGKVFEYDDSRPSGSKWIQKTSMPTARYDHSVVAYDNRYIFAIGGHIYTGDKRRYGYIERYDTETDTWLDYTNFTQIEPREDHEAVELNGNIYIIGGTESTTSYSRRCEVFDPTNPTQNVVRLADMPTGRNAHDIATVNGKIYVIGGYSSSGYSSECEEYNPTANTWKTMDNIPTPRRHLGTINIDNKIFAIGGFNSTTTGMNYSLSVVEVFNPLAPTKYQWNTLSEMSTSKGRDRFAIGTVNNQVIIAGGWNGDGTDFGWFVSTSDNQVEKFTPPQYIFSPLINDFSLDMSSKLMTKSKIDTIRTKVNEFRQLNGLQPYQWTDGTITQYKTNIKAIHWNEIKQAIKEVYNTFSKDYVDDQTKTAIDKQVTNKNSIRDIRGEIEAILKGIKGK